MLNPKEKCAVFLDIDGTLIADSFIIPPENLKAIKAAREKGHMVFVNTGRSWGNIPPVLMEQIKDFDGIIAGSGAMVKIANETVFSGSLSNDLVFRIAGFVFSNPQYWATFEGYYSNYVITNGIRHCNEFQQHIGSMSELKKACEADEIQVIAMGGEPISEEFETLFADEITVFQFSYYADLVKKGLNKAVGIEKVLEFTGIRRENTIAIGDSNNDYDMLKYAGIGVAMANSQQSILDMADYITDSNSENGVAKATEKFLL